jgi:hypothetical protein
MTTTEKFLTKAIDGLTDNEWIKLIQAVHCYAEFYAKKCLEIAAKEASANFECIGAVLGAENVNPYVEQESILKIKLPPHD